MRSFYLSVATGLIVSTLVVGCNQSGESVSDPNLTDPVEATSVSFANTKCPIMGGKPNTELSAEYDGKTIGFCCDGCPEKWAALDAEEKAEKFANVDAHAVRDRADGSAGSDHDHAGHADDSTE